MAKAELCNGITLDYEIHGKPENPTILVILGITDNITDWPPGLYEPLVEKNFQVVCYELRDSGLSTKLESEGHPDLGLAMAALENGELPTAAYTGHDMAEDAVLLIDYLGIDDCCVVGYSYGAMVAQLLALNHSNRVRSLVCLQGSNYNPDLPTRTDKVLQAMNAATKVYSDSQSQVEAMTNLRLATNGEIHCMDPSEASLSATNSVSRMYCPQGTARIVLSRLATPPFFQDTAKISCPTLVLHGDNDPIFPVEHGMDIANRIPNATLIVLKGAGHNHPLSLQPIISRHIINFAVGS